MQTSEKRSHVKIRNRAALSITALFGLFYLSRSSPSMPVPTFSKDPDLFVSDSHSMMPNLPNTQHLFQLWSPQQQLYSQDRHAQLLAALTVKAERPQKPYNMVMCTRIWNEARYLDEWIVYHYMLGFDHFILNDHQSEDNSSVILKPYIDAGLVTMTFAPVNSTIFESERAAREHCIDGSVISNDDMRWVSQIDLDEFLVLTHQNVKPSVFRPTPVQNLLTEYESRKEAVIQVSRLHIGTGDHMTPPAYPIMQANSYHNRRFLKMPGNFWPKIISRAGKWKQIPSAEHGTQHCAHAVEGWTRVTVDHQIIPERNVEKISEWNYINIWPVIFDPLHIAHFHSRSLEECLSKSRHPRLRGSWRAMEGINSTCHAWHPSYPGYDATEFTSYHQLSESIYTKATRLILESGGLFQSTSKL